MSTKAQKAFAKAVSLGDTPEGDAFREGVKRMGPMYYVDENGQKFTIHGNIPFGNRVKKARPQRSTQAKRATRKSVTKAQHSDPGTGPRRAGWIPPNPKLPKTRKEFLREESDFVARSVIERRNRGYF